MYANRVEVFHRADGDNVALAVAHYLELYLLPARNALFDKHLRYRRQAQAVRRYLVQLLGSLRDTAARTAERERGAHDNGVVYFLRERHCVLYGLYHL